jgi:hypothetical protein
MQQGSGRSNFAGQGGGQLLAAMLKGLSRAIAMTIEVFIHRDFGHWYVNSGFMGVIAIFVFAAFFPDQDLRPMYLFMLVFGVRWLIVATIAGVRYWRGKNVVHSRYTGRPYLWALLPSWKEVNVKHLESVAALVAGFLLHHFYRPLGDYVLSAATVVLLRGYNYDMNQRDRAVEMNDSVIETQMAAEKFREMRPR